VASGSITSAVLARRSAAADLVRGLAIVEREFMASRFSWHDIEQV
jgi:hypothetical protein